MHESAEQREVMRCIRETSTSLYVTGPAGSGKSTLIKRISAETGKNIVVLAPTGIAAVNAGGETIHSFCRLPYHIIMPNDEAIKHLPPQHKDLIKAIDTIVVDEISMVRADVLDGMDQFFRMNSGNAAPFGGKQVVFIGDPFQIEPIMPKDPQMKGLFNEIYDSPFFFSSRVFAQLAPRRIELKAVYRQKDSRFVDLLNRMRIGAQDISDITMLNRACYEAQQQDAGVRITLCTTNAAADQINKSHMDRLSGAPRSFMGSVTGVFPQDKMVAPQELELKVGAQVVLLANDTLRRYVNGSIGTVQSMKEDAIEVKLEDGSVVEVGRRAWEHHQYTVDRKNRKVKSEVVGYFTQFPMKAAWAITIHKSQGLTFSRVRVDLGMRGAFSCGQTYVALSRCKSIQGLRLQKAISASDVMVSREVLEFEGKELPKVKSALDILFGK
jgi:ATP-dependent exoDNAse (exonuclease V) alpha subunit